MKTLIQDSRCPGQDLNQVPPEYNTIQYFTGCIETRLRAEWPRFDYWQG